MSFPGVRFGEESSSLPFRFFQSAEIPRLPASLSLCTSWGASSALSGPSPWAVRNPGAQ